MNAARYSTFPFIPLFTSDSAEVYPPDLNTAIARAEFIIGTVIVSIAGIDFSKIPFASPSDIFPITIARAPPTNPATSISNFLYSINIIIINGITVNTAINPSGFCITFSASSANVIPETNNIENMTFKIKEFFLNIFFLLSGAHSPVN